MVTASRSGRAPSKGKGKTKAPEQSGDKTQVVSQHRLHDTDTGSPEVQVALLTQRIEQLTKHFETHVKDHASRQGLLKLVGKRRTHLEYLKAQDVKRYSGLIEKLN